MGVQLGAGYKGRAAAKVVRAVGLGGQRFGSVMGRYAQNLIRPQQGAGALSGHIALAHMHAVRPGCQSNLDIIINHKRHMAEVAQGGQFLGFGQQVVFVQAFFPQLHKGCPAVNGLGHYIGKAAAVQPGAVGHSVQAQLLRQNFHKQNLQKRQNKKRARRKKAHPFCTRMLHSPYVGITHIRFIGSEPIVPSQP